MTESPSRLRRAARAAAINGTLLLVSVLVAVAIAEMGVRLIMPQQLVQMRPDLWKPADSLGWLHQSNVRTTINTGERTVSIFTDADGFRVGRDGRTQDGTPVLILGDSFMEALQVEYEQSFAGLLEERLGTATGQPVAVRNAGIDGWAPHQYLIRARQILPRETFALAIVAIYVGNDVLPRRVEHEPPRVPVELATFRFPRSVSLSEFVEAVLMPLNDALEPRSHAYTLVKNRLGTLRMRMGVSPLYVPQEFLVSEADAERWDIIGEISYEIAATAAEHGTSTLFVLIPANFQVDASVFDQYVRGFGIDPASVDLDQPSRLVRQQLTDRGLNVLDVLEEFRTEASRGARLYGVVDPHLTPQGHDVLADIVLVRVAALLAEP